MKPPTPIFSRREKGNPKKGNALRGPLTRDWQGTPPTSGEKEKSSAPKSDQLLHEMRALAIISSSSSPHSR
jgi:hypothetical protein